MVNIVRLTRRRDRRGKRWHSSRFGRQPRQIIIVLMAWLLQLRSPGYSGFATLFLVTFPNCNRGSVPFASTFRIPFVACQRVPQTTIMRWGYRGRVRFTVPVRFTLLLELTVVVPGVIPRSACCCTLSVPSFRRFLLNEDWSCRLTVCSKRHRCWGWGRRRVARSGHRWHYWRRSRWVKPVFVRLEKTRRSLLIPSGRAGRPGTILLRERVIKPWFIVLTVVTRRARAGVPVLAAIVFERRVPFVGSVFRPCFLTRRMMYVKPRGIRLFMVVSL